MLLYIPSKIALGYEVTEEDDFDDEYENVYRGTLTEDELARLDKADMDYDLYMEDKLFLRR